MGRIVDIYGLRYGQIWAIPGSEKEEAEMTKKKENERGERAVPYRNDLTVKKSNYLIGAKYRATLTEIQLTTVAHDKLQKGLFQVTDTGIKVTLSATELKTLFGIKGHNFYSSLDAAAANMTGRTIGMTDPESKTFIYIAVIIKTVYEKGELSIFFNKAVSGALLHLTCDYTNLDKSLIYRMKSAYTCRLYEILRAECYYPKGYKGRKDWIFEVEKDLAELRFLLGVANADSVEARKILANKNPDYEKALEKTSQKIKSYDLWTNFEKRCIKPAVKEINEMPGSELKVSYHVGAKGKRGRIASVVFLAELIKGNTEDAVVASDDKNQPEILIRCARLFPEMPWKDIESICRSAGYDFAKIDKAGRLLSNLKEKPDNPTGWLINAIKTGYDSPKKKKPANKFNDFEQRNTNLDELEDLLTRIRSTGL